ncbi:MAG: FkbM family methyltransferase [Thermoleophilia bacterium]|nr:FkbM family methyltransferase [Thermoleophilia bacterium]
MKIAGISKDTLLGRILRLPLKLVPGSARVPILRGRLRGTKWIAGSSANNGCWLGSYEYEQRLAFEKLVPENATVYDVGAHAGFYTLLSSLLVGPRGRVIAFEPLPRNLHFLREHLRLNHVTNVEVIETALAERAGEVNFAEGVNSFNARIATDGGIRVKTAALDELVGGGRLPAPDYIKMDIEGAETLALKGAGHTLKKYHPTIFLTTHGPDIHEECVDILKEAGYELVFLDSEGKKGISRKIVARFPG